MISRWKRDKPPVTQPLSNRAIVLWAVVVLGIGAVAFTMLLWRYGGLDAIRTATAITVATGGAATLLLAARRQRSTEETLEHQRQTLEHQREVAQATERDAAEQRITELYTRAVDQLGAKDAPVRLGGLHALERLAQNNPTQRQTIVDVICSYLRMPYVPPDRAPDEDAPEDTHRRHEQRRQELQVRLTAQHILSAHLKPEVVEAYWENIDLNLTETYLHQLDLTACQVRSAQFGGATFGDQAEFNWATFTGEADFDGVTFTGEAEFTGAEFTGDAWFGGVEFAGHGTFPRATFAGRVAFGGATFGGATFSEAKFTGANFVRTRNFDGVTFIAATFAGNAYFDGAQFAGNVEFSRTRFVGDVDFDGATFAGDLDFDGATFAGDLDFDGTRVAPSGRVVLPMGRTTRRATEREGKGWLYVVRGEYPREQSAAAPDDGKGGSAEETGT